MEKKKNDSKPKPVEFRLDQDGALDEVFLENANVHIERMHKTGYWIGFDLQDGGRILLNTGLSRGQWFFTVQEGQAGGRIFSVHRPRRKAKKTAPDPAAGTSAPHT